MARASGDVDLEFFAGFFAAIGADRAGRRRRRPGAELEALAGPVTASQNFYFGFLVDRLLVSLDILTGRARRPGPDRRARRALRRHPRRHRAAPGRCRPAAWRCRPATSATSRRRCGR